MFADWEKDFDRKARLTIYTKDGYIVDGRRFIHPPFGSEIPTTELIGATITEVYGDSFVAVISEKTLHVSCDDGEGLTITAIEIDASENESLLPVPMKLKHFDDYVEDNEDE